MYVRKIFRGDRLLLQCKGDILKISNKNKFVEREQVAASDFFREIVVGENDQVGRFAKSSRRSKLNKKVGAPELSHVIGEMHCWMQKSAGC